jgi:hypothetical protein
MIRSATPLDGVDAARAEGGLDEVRHQVFDHMHDSLIDSFVTEPEPYQTFVPASRAREKKNVFDKACAIHLFDGLATID